MIPSGMIGTWTRKRARNGHHRHEDLNGIPNDRNSCHHLERIISRQRAKNDNVTWR